MTTAAAALFLFTAKKNFHVADWTAMVRWLDWTDEWTDADGSPPGFAIEH